VERQCGLGIELADREKVVASQALRIPPRAPAALGVVGGCLESITVSTLKCRHIYGVALNRLRSAH
jgi:hypothetical protein